MEEKLDKKTLEYLLKLFEKRLEFLESSNEQTAHLAKQQECTLSIIKIQQLILETTFII